MRRRLHVAAVVIVAVLTAMHAPAAVAQTSDGLVVGSQHDSQTDFENAQQLTNLSATSSGDGAVELSTARFFDDFDSYSVGTDVTTTTKWEDSTSKSDDNNDGTKTISDSKSESSPNSLNLSYSSSGSEYVRPAEQPYGSGISDTIALDMSSGGGNSLILYEGSTILLRVRISDEDGDGDVDLSYYDGSSWNILDSDAFTESDFVHVEVSDVDGDGNGYTISWSGPNGSGSASGLTFENAPSNGYTETAIGVYSGTLNVDDFQIGGRANSGKYVSPVHNVSNGQEAAINITQASNVSIDAQVRTDGGTTLGSATITSTGNHTISLSDTSSESLETVVDVTVTGENPQFKLADESILFANDAPTLNNSSASPTGEISQNEVELAIDASDPQFESAQGEDLTATFYVDGSAVGTDTITSNGTASVDYTTSTGGTHSWHVVVEDSYGASTTSDTFEFRAPSELEIRNESDPTQLLNNATVTLQFYGDESTDTPITVTRSVSDGTANLTGLPVDQPLVVVASADGFHDRRIFLSSLYDQQEIYLLPDDRAVVQPTYVLEDFSGYYPKENSVLTVQREINGSYQTVVGDYFGATGEFEATLREGVRHRLVITNTDTGRSRVLGTTMATDSADKVIRVLNDEEIELVEPDDRAPLVDPSLSTLPAAATEIGVTTFANDSQSYDVTVTYQNGSVSDMLASTTVSGNSEAALNIDLSDRSGGTVWVNISWTTAQGNDATKSVEYSVEKVYVGSQSLLDWVSIVPGEFGGNASAVTSFISVLLTVLLVGVVAQSARPSAQLLGLIGLAGLASFAVIGWLSYDVLFASSVGYFGIIAIREGL